MPPLAPLPAALPLDLPVQHAPAGIDRAPPLWDLLPASPQHQLEHCLPIERVSRRKIKVRLWQRRPGQPWRETPRIFAVERTRLRAPAPLREDARATAQALNDLPWAGQGPDPLHAER